MTSKENMKMSTSLADDFRVKSKFFRGTSNLVYDAIKAAHFSTFLEKALHLWNRSRVHPKVNLQFRIQNNYVEKPKSLLTRKNFFYRRLKFL